MRTALMLLSFCALAHANAQTTEEIQAYCGDDLRCYFSGAELQEALGPDLAAKESSYQAMPIDLFADEDEDMIEAPMSVEPAKNGPIWASFIANFRKCAPGCVPANYSTYGRRGKPSCHDTGKAADVGAIVCGGVTHTALKRGRFEKMVGCMKGKMIVLYRNGKGITTGHHDHAHFSNGCILKGGRKYYGDLPEAE